MKHFGCRHMSHFFPVDQVEHHKLKQPVAHDFSYPNPLIKVSKGQKINKVQKMGKNHYIPSKQELHFSPIREREKSGQNLSLYSILYSTPPREEVRFCTSFFTLSGLSVKKVNFMISAILNGGGGEIFCKLKWVIINFKT